MTRTSLLGVVACLLPTTALASEAVVPPILANAVDPQAAANMSGLLASEADFLGAFDFVTQLDERPAGFTTACLSSASCLNSIAKASNVQAVVAGAVNRESGGYAVTLVYFDKGKIVRTVEGHVGTDPSAIVESLGGYVKEVVTGQTVEAVAAAEAKVSADEFDEFSDDFEDDGGFSFDEYDSEAERSAQRKAEEARLRQEEQARLRQEEEARLRRQEEEARLRREEEERRLAEERRAEAERKAEAERLRREEAERQRREQEERRLAEERRAEAERKAEAQRQAEADRKAEAQRQAEADRKAAQQHDFLPDDDLADAEDDDDDLDLDSISFTQPKEEDYDLDSISFGGGAASIMIEGDEDSGPGLTLDEPEPAPKPATLDDTLDSAFSAFDSSMGGGSSSGGDLFSDDELDELGAAFDDKPKTPSKSTSTIKDLDDDEPAKPAKKAEIEKKPASKTDKEADEDDDVASKRDLDKPERPPRSEPEFHHRVSATARGGYSAFQGMNFVTYGGEASFLLLPYLAVCAGMEGHSVKRDVPAALQEIGMPAVMWNTLMPMTVGVQGRMPSGSLQAYGGLDAVIVPGLVRTLGETSGAAGGFQARAGVDYFVVDNFGVNLNLSAGMWSSEGFAEVGRDLSSRALVPSVSAGTVVAF